MALRIETVTIDAVDPARARRVLVRRRSTGASASTRTATSGSSRARTTPSTAPPGRSSSCGSPRGRPGKNRIHLDLVPDDHEREVERLEALGATRPDIGQTGNESWVVLADPEGNEFCVLGASPTATGRLTAGPGARPSAGGLLGGGLLLGRLAVGLELVEQGHPLLADRRVEALRRCARASTGRRRTWPAPRGAGSTPRSSGPPTCRPARSRAWPGPTAGRRPWAPRPRGRPSRPGPSGTLADIRVRATGAMALAVMP